MVSASCTTTYFFECGSRSPSAEMSRAGIVRRGPLMWRSERSIALRAGTILHWIWAADAIGRCLFVL
jgi:hypothetical protein